MIDSEAYYDRIRMEQDAMPDITILRQKTVRARKTHECTYCRKAIPVGGRHEYVAYIDDDDGGRLKTSRRCGPCIVGAYDDF